MGVAKLVGDILKPSITVRSRLMHSKYLKKIIDTQRVGQHADAATVSVVNDTHALLSSAALLMLRRLQRAIQKYLWRPGGPMMYKHYASLAVTGVVE